MFTVSETAAHRRLLRHVAMAAFVVPSRSSRHVLSRRPRPHRRQSRRPRHRRWPRRLRRFRRREANCLIPGFAGANLSCEWQGAPWAGFDLARTAAHHPRGW